MLQQFLKDKAYRSKTEAEKEEEEEKPLVYPSHMRRIESYGSFTVSTFGRRESNGSSISKRRGSMQSMLDRSDRSLRSSGNSYENVIRGDLSCFGEEYEVPTKIEKQQKTTFGSLRKSTGSMGDLSAMTSESVGASLGGDRCSMRRSSLFSMFGQDSIGDDTAVLDSIQAETNNRMTDTVDNNYEITCRRSVTEVLLMEDNRSLDFRLTFDDPAESSASSSRKFKSEPANKTSSRKKFSSSYKLETEESKEMQDLINCILSNEGIATSASDGQNPSAKEALNASERSVASSGSSRRMRRWCPKKAAKSKQREDNMSSARSGETLLVDWGEFSSDDECDDPRPIDDSERAVHGLSFRQIDDSLTFVDSDDEDSIDRWIDDALMNGVGGANNNSTRGEEGAVRRRCSAVKEEGLDEMDVSERSY